MVGVIEQDTIEEVGRRLAAAAGKGAKIILFGSHARGDADEDSDIDLLVIEPEVESRHAESIRLRQALRGMLVPMDIVVASTRHVEEWGEVHGTLVQAALAEGRVLHG